MTELVRLARGLYRAPSSVAELADRCAAFLDVMPAGTVIGGITAARLHGLWLPSPRIDELVELVETRLDARPHELPGSRRAEIRVRRRALRPDEIAIHEGLPLTAESRTWVDLAEQLGQPDLVAAGDSVLRGGVTTEALAAAVHGAHRRRGVRRAREALNLLDARSRSRPESHLRCLLVVGGLPYPQVNRAIYSVHGEWLAEPDLHYERAKLAIEYNGAGHADVNRMRKDITREIDVDGHGWKVVVFGPNEVFTHAHRVAPYIRSILAQRDREWWRRPLR